MPRKKEAAPVKVEPTTVESVHKGGFLHLGDGRKLAFGECAQVTPEVAALLIERGQAK